MVSNPVKRLIYFVETPFNTRDYKRFGVETLIKNNFEVQVWDFTPFLNPNGYNNTIIRGKNNELHSLFFSKKKALREISNLNTSCFVVCLITFGIRSYSIFKLLSKKRIRYCIFKANTIPTFLKGRKNFNFMYYKFKNMNAFKILNLVISRYPFNTMLGLKPATLVLAGGEKSISYNKYKYPLANDVEKLWLHALDYDIYLRKNKSIPANAKLAVFLDEYLPFHSDYIYLNIKPYASPDEYYPLICKFFDKIEKKYKIKIVIAAHPRSNYKKNSDLYDGRLVIKNRTFELIRESRFVIAHCSTAINFVVLLKKPIVFITTNRLKKTMEGQTIDVVATILGKKPINIDEPLDINIEKELIVNEKLYRLYSNDYIKKKGSEENLFWQMVAERLKKGFDKN